MSQAGIANFNNSGLSFIQTINGDTGSITGHTVTIYTGRYEPFFLQDAGGSVQFTNSGTVSKLLLNDYGTGSMALGAGSGNSAGTGGGSPGLGTLNTFIGVQAGLSSQTTSGHNVIVGYGGGYGQVTDGTGNVFLGSTAAPFAYVQPANNYNIAIGYLSFSGVAPGSQNVCIGKSTGTQWGAFESNNIIINHIGGIGDNNTMRLGTQGSGAGQINKTFIAGIVGVTASNAQLVTINSSTGQLGVVSGSPVVSTWTDVTGATQTLAVGNGYATDNAGGVTYTLPATATFGDLIKIVGKSGIATITPNANQQIVIGSINGTVGVTGTAVAQIAGSCIALRCITGGASTVWRAEEYPGGWTLT